MPVFCVSCLLYVHNMWWKGFVCNGITVVASLYICWELGDVILDIVCWIIYTINCILKRWIF